MNAATTQTNRSWTYGTTDPYRSARANARSRGRERRLDILSPLRLAARILAAIGYGAVALVTSVAALAAAIVTVPFLLIAPIAVVGLVILLAAYVLSGLSLI